MIRVVQQYSRGPLLLRKVACHASTAYSSRDFSSSVDGAKAKNSTRHETWREDNDTDNLPKVKKRDGTIGTIDKNRGFVDYHRIAEPYRDPLERVFDWSEINFDIPQHDEGTSHHHISLFAYHSKHRILAVERTVQAARCMDCGTPFCQTHTVDR